MAYQGTPGYSGVPAAAAYSDWITRVGAYLIDAVPVVAAAIVFGILIAIVHNVVFSILLWLIFSVASIGYQVYNRWILGGQGQTIGKRQMKIKLVSEETGQPIGTLNAFLRDICHLVDGIICDIGYLFPLWDPKRQTLADKIMKTVVVPA